MSLIDPLRVAVIGSGPAGFYTVQHLFQAVEGQVSIDMFDRLPTPFGLVRTGVAPDHPKIKAVATLYHKLALKPGFRFFGNVEYGKDLLIDDLRRHYHQVVFACGSQADREIGVPGEHLSGVHSAREFVAWYNGDPNHSHDVFNFAVEGAVVVGVGNVAADVARILCRVHDKLAVTDIADYALEALRHSKIRAVHVLGRRGPVQSKISPPEVRELGDLVDAETSTIPEEMELDEYSRAELDNAENDEVRRKYEALLELSGRREPRKHRKLILRFMVSPVEILGDEQGRARGIKIVRNRLVRGEDGRIRPRPTDQFEVIECGLVFRSVGYKGVALPGMPFDEREGVIPNRQGRVLESANGDGLMTGFYAVGWIKRGPSGLIGSNKACARETVNLMKEDLEAARTLPPAEPSESAIEGLLRSCGVEYFTYQDWMRIDALEVERGRAGGRPRVKFTEREEFLELLRAARDQARTGS